MRTIFVVVLLFLLNCKVNKSTITDDCVASKHCTVNIHIADSLYENSLPFIGVNDLNNPINGAQTDFNGNASITIERPLNDTLVIGIYLPGQKKDTLLMVTKRCIDSYSFDYYIPKWYKEYFKKYPIKTPKYNQDINYGNEIK